MHALSEEFNATELRRARASLETIDLRALEYCFFDVLGAVAV